MNPPPMRQPEKWETVFFNIAFDIAEKSKDNSTQCGAVLVNADNVILGTGFNGPPPDIFDNLVPWNDRPQKYAYIIHAEENAILFALDRGCNLKGSTLYVTHMPCAECMLRIIRAKVKCVVVPECHADYPLSKFQVDPQEIIDKQRMPKLQVHKVKYVKRSERQRIEAQSE